MSYKKEIKNDRGELKTIKQFWEDTFRTRCALTLNIPENKQDYDQAHDHYQEFLQFERNQMPLMEILIMTCRKYKYIANGDPGSFRAFPTGTIEIHKEHRGLEGVNLVLAFFNLLQERKTTQQLIICELEQTEYYSALDPADPELEDTK